MTNDTCVKSSMARQAYKVVRTHSCEISRRTIISRLLHSRSPRLWGKNRDVPSDLVILAFKNGEQVEDFHTKILRLQQEINLSGETVSTTRLLFQYIKALSNIDEPKAFIAPKMTDIITLIDGNGKYAVNTQGNIHGIYRYLEMIEHPQHWPLQVSSLKM